MDGFSKVPQATMVKLKDFARSCGHEGALALDVRFVARGKYNFMQIEVCMGILPFESGASRMARQTRLSKELGIILSAPDYDADVSKRFRTINKAPNPDEIGLYVDALAKRIA